MLRHKELMSRLKFAITWKLGQFFVVTDEKFVATSNVMFKVTYVATMRKICRNINFLSNL